MGQTVCLANSWSPGASALVGFSGPAPIVSWYRRPATFRGVVSPVSMLF
jgi:hypothetical protein